MTLFNIYSKAAGWARAAITLLSAVLVFITANGPVNNPVVAKVSAAVIAAIQLLTRFTGLGDKPPQLAPDTGSGPVAPPQP